MRRRLLLHSFTSVSVVFVFRLLQVLILGNQESLRRPILRGGYERFVISANVTRLVEGCPFDWPDGRSLMENQRDGSLKHFADRARPAVMSLTAQF